MPDVAFRKFFWAKVRKKVSSSRDIANFSLLNCIVCNEEKSSDQDDAGMLNMIRLESLAIELPNKMDIRRILQCEALGQDAYLMDLHAVGVAASDHVEVHCKPIAT